MLIFSITPSETEQTLISFLKKRFKTTPLTLIYKLFRTKKIKVNQKNIRYYHYRLKDEDKVVIYDNSLKISLPNNPLPPKKTPSEIKPVYEDKNILIVYKEHNLSMPVLDRAAQYYFYHQNPSLYQQLQEQYFSFTSIHRLDKLAAGLVIYPKNPMAKRILYRAINDKEKITKNYLVGCENKKISLPNYIEGYLRKNETKQKMEFSPKYNEKGTQFCAMEIKKVGQESNKLLLEITLYTGRKHQIRAILSYLDLPVIGDKKYGSPLELKNKINLLAYKISFNKLPSPLTYLNGKIWEFKSTSLS